MFGAFLGIDDERLSEDVNRALEMEGAPTGSMLSSSTALRAAKPVVNEMSVSFK